MELFDCIVVGTGPGGSAALESICRGSGRSLRVAVVDCGKFGRGIFNARTEFVGRPFGLPVTTDFGVGGTGNLWHGVTAPFEDDDVAGWPITYDDVYKHAREALALVCSDDAYSFLFRNKKSAADFFDNANLVDFELKTFAFKKKVPRFGKMVLEKVRHNQVCMFNDHFVDSILIEEDRVRGELYCISCITPSGNKMLYASSVVLAAGALVTPQILLKSGFSNGAMFRKNLPSLGRYLSDHPMGSFGQIDFSEPFFSPLVTDLCVDGVRHRVGFTCKQSAGFLNHNLYLRPSVKRRNQESHINRLRKLISHNSYAKLVALVLYETLKDPSVVKSIYLNKFTVLPPKIKNCDFFCVLEQTPSPASRIFINEAGSPFEFAVDWRIERRDLEEYFRYFNFVGDAFSRGGDGLVTKFYDSPESIQFLTSAAHHSGTCRMGFSPEDSCVDRDLRVHGTKRLFVSDASVFPRIGNANVTFSIAALAYRCGSHVSSVLSELQT